MPIQNKICALMFFLFVAVISSSAQAGKSSKSEPKSPPHVVVTIKPIHSLVTGIMEGIGEPELLMEGDSSPHHTQLKPSEEQKLYGAQVIIWVGDIYEGGLKRRLENIQGSVQIITIAELEGIQLYPYRQFKDKDGHTHGGQPCCDHTHGHSANGDHHHEISGKDGHLWLAPNNAALLVTQIAKKLATLDIKHASLYMANSKKVLSKIQALAVDIKNDLKDVKGKPYLTFHDFTQYFDRYFGTNCVGVIRLDPNVEPSPKHLREIQLQIDAKSVNVLFAEPQFDDKVIKMLVKDSNIRPAQLDYLGYGLEKGPELYFEMMRRLSLDMSAALSGEDYPGAKLVKRVFSSYSS